MVGTAYSTDRKWYFVWYSDGSLTSQFIDEETGLGDAPRDIAWRPWNMNEFTEYKEASHNYLAPNVHLDHNQVHSISGSIG